MTKLTLVILSLAYLPSAFADEGKVCAAIKSCDVVQVSKIGRKKSTSKNNLKFDELCGADVHSLPLKGGMELELAIKNNQVIVKLNGAGTAVATKKVSLAAKKLTIKYVAKKEGEPNVNVSCTP
jgi:hypothetical protein